MDDLQQRNHFWRRATFGATLTELNDPTAPEDLLAGWLNTPATLNVPDLGPIVPANQRGPVVTQFNRWLLDQMVKAENPLHERIVDFWRNHFVVSIKQLGAPQYLTDYETRLRTYALGDFQDLLWQVTISPAMLSYLNGNQNRVNNINENFSREVMELFTIGIGNYTEKDVQEGARAFTGWQIVTDKAAGQYTSRFAAAQHDKGVKTYLGQTGNFKAEDIINILANHPETGGFLARKMWKTFVYPNPEPKVIAPIADAYYQSNRSIAAMVQALFTSPEFYSDKAYRSRVKTPIEFLIGTLRELEIPANYDRVVQGLRSMGQPIYAPPSVKGWSDDWLTAPSLITRLNLSQQLTQQYADDSMGFSYDPNKFSIANLLQLLIDGQDDSNVQGNVQGLTARQIAALFVSCPTYQFA